jgi:hypothetical protein
MQQGYVHPPGPSVNRLTDIRPIYEIVIRGNSTETGKGDMLIVVEGFIAGVEE